MEKLHEQSQDQETQGMETVIDFSSIFVKDNADLENVDEILNFVFIFPPLHTFFIHELNITLAMLLTFVQCLSPFYQN